MNYASVEKPNKLFTEADKYTERDPTKDKDVYLPSGVKFNGTEYALQLLSGKSHGRLSPLRLMHANRLFESLPVEWKRIAHLHDQKSVKDKKTLRYIFDHMKENGLKSSDFTALNTPHVLPPYLHGYGNTPTTVDIYYYLLHKKTTFQDGSMEKSVAVYCFEHGILTGVLAWRGDGDSTGRKEGSYWDDGERWKIYAFLALGKEKAETLIIKSTNLPKKRLSGSGNRSKSLSGTHQTVF